MQFDIEFGSTQFPLHESRPLASCFAFDGAKGGVLWRFMPCLACCVSHAFLYWPISTAVKHRAHVFAVVFAPCRSARDLNPSRFPRISCNEDSSKLLEPRYLQPECETPQAWEMHMVLANEGREDLAEASRLDFRAVRTSVQDITRTLGDLGTDHVGAASVSLISSILRVVLPAFSHVSSRIFATSVIYAPKYFGKCPTMHCQLKNYEQACCTERHRPFRKGNKFPVTCVYIARLWRSIYGAT